MFVQPRDNVPAQLEEFSRPVESIMRCEDFKSNFARRLSNRYISRSPVSSPRQDNTLKLRPPNNNSTDNVPERIEQCSQLSKTVVAEQNVVAAKPCDKTASDMRHTEVTALNMEVDTLRWQLAQTEANRQMHIALLRQVVTFLNKVKEHIQGQQNDVEPKMETLSAKMLPRSFNFTELPRSRSVLHVNKSLDYSLSSSKRTSTRKISKSISNVNGYKDCSGIWSQSKLSLAPECESSQKLSEEMSRLITLANTVLSTKLPDLACTCTDTTKDIISSKLIETINKDTIKLNETTRTLNLVEEDATETFILKICDESNNYNEINKYAAEKDKSLHNDILSPPPLSREFENDFAAIKINDKEKSPLKSVSEIISNVKTGVDKKNEYNHSANFIEDESGFSSMNSFQEIGIPIISIIPPSPSKEVGFIEEIPDLLEETPKWKNDTLGIDKHAVKVFWV